MTGAGEYHINADEPIFLDYNTEFNPPSAFQPNEFRAADHDPLLVGVCETTPPELDVSVSPSTLWPPNHKYRNVTATVDVSDGVDPDPSLELVSVTSNEPDNGADDGNTVNDIVIVDDFHFKLRAERSGIGTGPRVHDHVQGDRRLRERDDGFRDGHGPDEQVGLKLRRPRALASGPPDRYRDGEAVATPQSTLLAGCTAAESCVTIASLFEPSVSATQSEPCPAPAGSPHWAVASGSHCR